MDIEFIETKEEIVIHAGNPKGAGWITRNLTSNVTGIHYTDKRHALHLLNTAADDGLKVARRSEGGGVGKGLCLVRGEYHETGYEIFVNDESVYTAANSHGDSQLRVQPENGVGLKKLRQFCIQTGKEMAHERFAQWDGVERVSDPFDGELE